MKNFKRIIGVLLIVASVLAAMPVISFADRGFSKSSVDFYSFDEKAMFTDKDKPAFCLDLKNEADYLLKFMMDTIITDENGKVVWEKKAETVNVKANTIETKIIAPDLEKLGLFTIRVDLTGDFLPITKEITFSYSKANEEYDYDIGIHTTVSYNRDSLNHVLPIIEDAGFGWVRTEIQWDNIELIEGRYTVDPYYDKMMAELKDNGNKVLLILSYGNPLYCYQDYLPISDLAIRKYTEWCLFMVDRYRDKIDAVEIFNEPNLKAMAGPDTSPKNYTKVLKSAYEAIFAYDPTLSVVGGVLAGPSSDESRAFLQEMLVTHNAGNYMNILSIHPYVDTGDYLDERHEHTLQQQIEWTKEYLKEAGIPDMPIWITEFGTSSYYNMEDNNGYFNYSEYEQAVNHTRFAIIAKSDKQIENAFTFQLLQNGWDKTDWQHNYGILTPDYKAKNAYIAHSNVNELLNGVKPITRMASLNYKTRAFSLYQFRNGENNSEIYAIWTNSYKNRTATLTAKQNLTEATENAEGVFTYATATSDTVPKITINAPRGSVVKFVDMYGNDLGLSWEESYTVSAEPIFVIVSPKADNEISCESGIMTVRGNDAVPGSEVTIKVQRVLTPDKTEEYINQAKADESGVYSFEFAANDSDVYTVSVFNGVENREHKKENKDYLIDIDYFVNGKAYAGFNQIKPGDIIKAVLNITKTTDTPEKLMFYGTVKGNGERLISIDGKTVDMLENGTISVESEVEVKNKDEAESLSFYLWTESFKPIVPVIK